MEQSDAFEVAKRNANASLAESGVGLRIEQRGMRLNLRGSLPGRQTPERRSVQRLSLGVAANAQGLLEVEQIARVIDGQLKRDQFRWEQWSAAAAAETSTTDSSHRRGETPMNDQIEGFCAAFFADPRRRRSPSGSRTTWAGAYNPYLRRLRSLATQESEGVSSELLMLSLIHI